jgi:iron(III) transport system permease protein
VTTALLALAAATATVLAALPVAWLGVRVPGRFGRSVEACNYVIGALPGVIVAMALIFVTVRVAQPLYQTAMNLILAYVILFLPRAIVGLRASMAQVPASLEEAAVNLGRTPARAIVLTTLRLAAPGAAAGLAMAALGITNELTATLLLAPNGTRTLATAFWDHASELDYAAAAPFALMMIALSLPLTLVLRLPALGKGRPT